MAKELSFEQALGNLEKIVEELERGDFSLESSMKKYEEGIKLTKYCKEQLDKARKKIAIITKDKKGNFKTKDFKWEFDGE